MNATAWMLLSVTGFVLVWEFYFLFFGPMELTISRTLRAGGQWLALTIMLGATLLWWHIWIQECYWP